MLKFNSNVEKCAFFIGIIFYLQEALRLFPSVPLLGRELTEECKFGKKICMW
jgi:hypothetical protein